MRLLLSGEKASLSAGNSSNADVKRSCQLINTHGVFGTHNSAQSAGGFRETPPSAIVCPTSGTRTRNNRLSFLEAVADAVQRFDHVEFGVAGFELFAQPLDVAVDGAIIHIDLIVIGRIHQGVAAFHHAGAAR